MDSKICYNLVKIISSKSDSFFDFLGIYSQVIDYEQKTDTNEIKYWIDNSSKFKKGKLFFFGLMANDKAIGFSEVAYHRDYKMVMIDYIAIDKNYDSNSAFFSFYSLIIDFIKKEKIDYDFITKEILCRFNDTSEYASDIKLYELENFKVANCLYIQPLLDKKNLESEKEALLMIYQRSGLTREIKKETYFNIVQGIYDYYFEWDKSIIKNDDTVLNEYINRQKKYIEQIKVSLEDSTKITLNGYQKKHSYSADSKSIPNKEISIPKALLYTGIVTVVVMVILFFSKELNIELTTIALVTVAVLFVVLTFIGISNTKAAEAIRNLPIFSKLFSLLK